MISGNDGSGMTGVFRATGAAYSAVYGQTYMQMEGNFGRLNLGSLNNDLKLIRGGGRTAQFSVATTDSSGAGQHAYVIQMGDSGLSVFQIIGGVFSTSYTGTVQAAYSANKPVKNGMICN